MDKWFQEFKYTVVNFKLDLCCWLLPMRVGCLVTAIFNIITDFVSMVGIANEGFSPTILKVQEALIEDYVTKPPTILAYTLELAMNVVFLCAIYRKDVILLRLFMHYSMIALFMSILVYSIIIAAVPLELALVIIVGPLFQAYTIVLVRSYIVEVKLENKKYELPTLVMSTVREKETNNIAKDIEIKPENKEVIVVIPDAKEKDREKYIVKPSVSEITITDPPKQIEVKDEPKKIYEFKKVDRKFFDFRRDDKKEPKIEDRKIDVPKVEAKVGEKEKEVPKLEVKDKLDDIKDLKKDDKKGKDSNKDKDTKDDKDKESKDDKKVKEKEKKVRSVHSIFSRRNKKSKNADGETGDTETSEQKEKLETVDEHPKE